MSGSISSMTFISKDNGSKPTRLFFLYSPSSSESRDLLRKVSEKCRKYYTFINAEKHDLPPLIAAVKPAICVPIIIVLYEKGDVSIFDKESAANIVKNIELFSTQSGRNMSIPFPTDMLAESYNEAEESKGTVKEKIDKIISEREKIDSKFPQRVKGAK